MGLRLLDAGGETFQYQLGESSVKALQGTGWRQITATFDPNKPETNWGTKHDGVPRYPLRFLGFGLGHPSALPAEGDIVLHDITFQRAMEGMPAAVSAERHPSRSS